MQLDPPLLHLTVGLTAVVYEAGLISHPVAVYHHPTIQVQTIIATVGKVLLHHTAPEIRKKKMGRRLSAFINFQVKINNIFRQLTLDSFLPIMRPHELT